MATSNPENAKKTTSAVDNTFKSLGINTYNAVIKAPFIITATSCLLVNSAKQDFSLTEKSNNVTEFQYIKYPDSFHACVVQVSHGIIQAFNTAHHEMNSIRMKSENIVENVEKAIQVMNESGNNKKRIKNQWVIIEPYLRDTGKECAECIEKTASITKEFERVRKTMEELLEALVRSKGKYKNEQNATNLEMETTREKQDMEKKHKNELGKDCEETSNEIEDAKKNYEEAVNSFPSPWKIKLVKIFDSVTVLFSRKDSTSERVEPSTTPKITTEEANAYLVANDILLHAKMLMSTSCDKNNIAKVKISLKKMCSDPNLDAPQSDVRTVKELCKDGIEICNEINKEIDQGHYRSAATDARVKKFLGNAKNFHEKAKDIFQKLERYDPTDENKSGENPEGRYTKALLETPRKNEKKAREKLLDGYERYGNSYHKMVETTKELEKILDDMVKFGHQSLELSKICDVVKSSMETLNDVISHWETFCHMFKELHSTTDGKLQKKLDKIKERPSTAKKQNETGQLRLHPIVLKDSKEALEHAYILEGTSSFYCRVSKEYLLDGSTRLQSVISLDPIKDRDKMVEIQKELQNDQERMKDEILAIAEEKKEDLREKIKSTAQ